jgi:hypothetical protein
VGGRGGGGGGGGGCEPAADVVPAAAPAVAARGRRLRGPGEQDAMFAFSTTIRPTKDKSLCSTKAASEKDTASAQKLGQLQLFIVVRISNPTGMHGPTLGQSHTCLAPAPRAHGDGHGRLRATRRGRGGARSHCRYVLPLIRFTPESRTYSVPLFLKRQCDRTLGGGPRRCRARAVPPVGRGESEKFSAILPRECMGQPASFGPT